VDDELEWIWKEAVVTEFKVLSSTYLEGLRKTMKNLSQNIRSHGRDLNPGRPEALYCNMTYNVYTKSIIYQ
jgi:hypothetical protein